MVNSNKSGIDNTNRFICKFKIRNKKKKYQSKKVNIQKSITK